MNTFLEKLNSEQLKPVLDTEGAVLVLAGAGSGKTRVLTTRIAHIIDSGKADINSVLAITFTNKSANEMKERLEKMLGEGESKWICTIHSMCVKILRQFGEKIGLKQNFSIYSDTERNNLIKKAYTALDISDESVLKSAKFHIGNAKMLGLDPDLYARQNKYEKNIGEVAKIYAMYEEQLQANNALDFDDLLLYTLRLLRRDGETLGYLSDKFRYILVDEFQDTNAVQFSIIKLLATVHGNLFAVGDDDQSIYSWRGAEIDNILSFDKEFPDAKVYKLEQNYRSTKNILELANTVISRNLNRNGKTLWTDGDEGEKPQLYQADEETGEALFTVNKIIKGRTQGKSFSDFAVLMRINALTRSYEQEFTKYGIPYKVFGGFRFFERKEIKDVLAYMRLISNPFDNEALERIINVPKRGIGAKTVETMYSYAKEYSLSLYDACIDCNYIAVTKGAREKLAGFAELMKSFIIASQEIPVAELVRKIINDTELRNAYDDGTDEGDGKLANLDEFIASVDDFCRLNPNATLDEYLNQVTLSSDLDDADDGDYVTLSTIHAAKGLEFNEVFICGLEEGIMPSSRSNGDRRAFEEERRLMYVAVTRARKMLYLTRSKSRYLYGHRDITSPSKFITETADFFGIKNDALRSVRNFAERQTYRGVYSSADAYESDIPSTNKNFSFVPKRTVQPAKTTNAGKYQVGMKVLHKKFGLGMVVAVKNEGKIINVAFDGQGVKELSALLAPLEIV